MNKKLIFESVKNIVKEALDSKHYRERLFERFLDKSELVVGYEIPGTRGEYEEVGTYVLPDSIKEDILESARIIEKYNFPKSKSYGVQIANIIIDKNKIVYFGDSQMNEAKSKPLLFLDSVTESNGNLIYAIIRNNEIYTIYFAKNYVPQDASKLRVDVIIKNMNVIKQGKVR